jgi:glycosyltransferase involved in cell wall biosynthesis
MAAIYVNPANPHDIADAVETAINDKAERARLKRAMIDEAGRHSWDAAALRLATALKTNRA